MKRGHQHLAFVFLEQIWNWQSFWCWDKSIQLLSDNQNPR